MFVKQHNHKLLSICNFCSGCWAQPLCTWEHPKLQLHWDCWNLFFKHVHTIAFVDFEFLGLVDLYEKQESFIYILLMPLNHELELNSIVLFYMCSDKHTHVVIVAQWTWLCLSQPVLHDVSLKPVSLKPSLK